MCSSDLPRNCWHAACNMSSFWPCIFTCVQRIQSPLLVRPKTIVFGKTSVLRKMFFFIQREISEMRGPTGLKFCTMVSTRPNFIMPVQNFGGHTPKKFRGRKHAKFGPISDDFEVRRRIPPKRMKVFKIGFLFRLPRFLLR